MVIYKILRGVKLFELGFIYMYAAYPAMIELKQEY